ncbi:unnamed protein product [Effrenium voratum]|uniref:Amino acid transporter transmembrane domain-containing protein n=1 Tax=Effrenium voratum TaxID=2562239 RepID=A0AA36JA12_9DINO|nr:unnamed protein product [Effrenium voratum]
MPAESFEVEPAPAPAPAPKKSQMLRSICRASVCGHTVGDAITAAKLLEEEAAENGETSASKITPFEAIANFVIGCIGAGIVVFPKVMAQNGLGLALFLICVAAGVCFESGRLMVASCELTEALRKDSPGSCTNYEDLAGEAFGTLGKTVLAVTKNSYALGSLFVYTVLLTEGIASFLADVAPSLHSERAVRWFFVAPAVVALSMITNLKQLARVAPLGTAAVFGQCCAICVGSLFASLQEMPGRTRSVAMFDMLQIGSGLSVFVFGFDGVVNVPSIRGQMADPDTFAGALRTGFAVVCGFCVVVMLLGYLGFGCLVRDNVIMSISSTCSGLECILAHIANGGVNINLLISFPLIWFTVISFIESVAPGDLAKPLHPINMAFRAVTALMLIQLGLLFESPKDVISLVSAVFGSFLSIFFPLVFFYQLRRLAQRQGLVVPPVPPARQIGHGLVVLVGFVSLIFGFLQALKKFT